MKNKAFVTKQRLKGRWLNKFFNNELDAKKQCYKIIAQGGKAVWMRNAL